MKTSNIAVRYRCSTKLHPPKLQCHKWEDNKARNRHGTHFPHNNERSYLSKIPLQVIEPPALDNQ